MKILRRIVTLAVVLATSPFQACDEPVDAPLPCPPVVFPAVEVKVIDAVTLDLLSGAAHGLVTNGQQADSLRVCRVDGQGRVVTRCAAYGFWGTFYAVVSAVGYQTWDSTGVVVTRSDCGNLTTYLEVALTPMVIEQPQRLEPDWIGLPNTALQPPASRDEQR